MILQRRRITTRMTWVMMMMIPSCWLLLSRIKRPIPLLGQWVKDPRGHHLLLHHRRPSWRFYDSAASSLIRVIVAPYTSLVSVEFYYTGGVCSSQLHFRFWSWPAQAMIFCLEYPQRALRPTKQQQSKSINVEYPTEGGQCGQSERILVHKPQRPASILLLLPGKHCT